MNSPASKRLEPRLEPVAEDGGEKAHPPQIDAGHRDAPVAREVEAAQHRAVAAEHQAQIDVAKAVVAESGAMSGVTGQECGVLRPTPPSGAVTAMPLALKKASELLERLRWPRPESRG